MKSIMQETQFNLGKRELISLCNEHLLTLACISGEIWVTFDGRSDDIILKAGNSIELRGMKGIVLSGLQESRIGLTSTIGCRVNSMQSAAIADRRLRWNFPTLSSFPAHQLV